MKLIAKHGGSEVGDIVIQELNKDFFYTMFNQEVKLREILRDLESLPAARLEEIDRYLKSLLSRKPARRKKEPKTLRGIWAEKGFEKIINLEAEIKSGRKELGPSNSWTRAVDGLSSRYRSFNKAFFGDWNHRRKTGSGFLCTIHYLLFKTNLASS